MMMKSVFWWRKPEYPEETTDLQQVTDETFHTYGLCPGLAWNPAEVLVLLRTVLCGVAIIYARKLIRKTRSENVESLVC